MNLVIYSMKYEIIKKDSLSFILEEKIFVYRLWKIEIIKQEILYI